MTFPSPLPPTTTVFLRVSSVMKSIEFSANNLNRVLTPLSSQLLPHRRTHTPQAEGDPIMGSKAL